MNDMYLLWTFVISLAVIIVLILSKKVESVTLSFYRRDRGSHYWKS